jgi:hypothetical protein
MRDRSLLYVQTLIIEPGNVQGRGEMRDASKKKSNRLVA